MRSRVKLAVRWLATLIVGLTGAGVHAEAPLPVEAFASLPDVSQVSMAPGGERVAAIINIDRDGVLGTAVIVMEMETGKPSLPVFTDNEEFVMKWIRWASDEKLLVSARFPAQRFGTPTTETRLLVVDVASGDNRPVLSASFLRKQDWPPQFHDRVVDVLPDDPNHILLALSTERPQNSSVLRISLDKGRRKTIQRDKIGATDWLTDREGNLRIAVKFVDTTYTIQHKPIGGREWRTLWKFETFGEDQVWPIGFDGDPNKLYVRAYHEGYFALFEVDLASEGTPRRLVHSLPGYDFDGTIIYSRKNKRVVGVTESQTGAYEFWDSEYAMLQAGIDKALPDTRNFIVDFSEDERIYVVLATSSVDAGMYYVGDRDTGRLDPFSSRYRSLPPERMSPTEAFRYEARDGLWIEAFLTVPKDSEGKNLPAVIFPHGGPISYDTDGFDYWTQFFASRGYAVLQMNFRGSAGYGFDFMQSGLQSWGLEMQNDVEDATRWLIESGVADPGRICVVGASYGGYAALMEAARNSDLYRCAVSFAGVTDIPYLLTRLRRYTSYDVAKEQIGSDRSELRKRSPVSRVDAIDVPVLLVHGTKDRSVDVQHSRRFEKAMRKAGKSLTYIEQEDGDHYLSNQRHRLEFFRAMERFLADHLVVTGVTGSDQR